MKILFFVLITLSTFAALSCSSTKTIQNLPQPTPVASTTLPFELIDNRIFVDVYLNNQGPFKFMFDTGSVNVMTPEVAKKLRVSLTRDKDGTGAGEKTFRVDKTKVNQMRVGEANFVSNDFLVIDMNEIKKAFNMTAFDGTIGYEVLQQYMVDVNFEKSTLTLNSDLSKQIKKSYTAIPFQMAVDKPVIEGKIQNIPAKILVDTGDRSALTVFKNFRSNEDIQKIFMNSEEQITGYGAGGPIPALLGTTPRLELHPQITLKNVISRAPTTAKGFNILKEMNASVGNEVLKQFNVVFDYKNKIIYMKKNKFYGSATKFTEVPNLK